MSEKTDLNTFKKRVQTASEYLRKRIKAKPEIALFLGTGLGSAQGWMEKASSIPYKKIPGFSKVDAFGQKNEVVFGSIAGKPALSFEGRIHAYEGHSFREIGLPVRMAHALGASMLAATNIAGGIRSSFRCGDFVLIEDHLNFMGGNPLVGPHEAWMGERFVDLSDPYDSKLGRLMKQAAWEEGIRLKTGVYAAVLGPHLETKAEYRFLKKAGADLVGMSTVPEVLVARQLGMKAAVVSVISDECDPDHLKPIDVPKILRLAENAQKPLEKLIKRFIRSIEINS